jgi:hypothetical protein
MPSTVANKTYAHLRGFNYQPSYGSTGYELWRKFDAAIIDLELGRGKKHFPAFNAVRFWLSWDAFIRDPKLFAAQFETALSLTAKHGLAMMPVLFNRWHDPHLDYGGIYIDHFLPEAGHMQKPDMFGPFLEAIVGAHADDPRIFSWDLCNEPFNYYRGRAYINAYPHVAEAELAWLMELYRQCKKLGAKAPITVGMHPLSHIETVDACSDFFSIHPYIWDESYRYFDKLTFDELLDGYVNLANKTGKALLATEDCWGSQDDAHRVSLIKRTLDGLRARDIGHIDYLLNHSLIADAHRIEFGPLGKPGNLSFIEANGSVRPGHEIWNEYAI